MAIQRHPELGADMFKDLGMYGPVAEIVLAHHERVDEQRYLQWPIDGEIPRSRRSSGRARCTTR